MDPAGASVDERGGGEAAHPPPHTPGMATYRAYPGAAAPLRHRRPGLPTRAVTHLETERHTPHRTGHMTTRAVQGPPARRQTPPTREYYDDMDAKILMVDSGFCPRPAPVEADKEHAHSYQLRNTAGPVSDLANRAVAGYVGSVGR